MNRRDQVRREFEERRETLSKTETEVFELLIKRLPNKRIAIKLSVTEKTVKFHSTNIYRKFGISGTRQGKREILIATHKRSNE